MAASISRYAASGLNVAFLTGLLLVSGWSSPVQAQDSVSDRSQRVRKMTGAERERLQRNFAQFQQLSEADRQQYRNLHQSLASDEHGAALVNVMNKYYAWLKTLTVTQRDELRKETNPQRREELVRHYREEQSRFRSQQAERLNQGPFAGPNRGLNREDLASVMGVLEERLKQAKFLSEADARELDRLQGTEKYRAFMEKLRPRPNEPGLFVLLTQKEPFTAVVGAISNAEQRQHLLNIPQPPKQRMELLQLIGRGLLEQTRDDVNRGDIATLKSLFDRLDVKQREEILRTPPVQQRFRLLEFYRDQALPRWGQGEPGGPGRNSGGPPEGPPGGKEPRGNYPPDRKPNNDRPNNDRPPPPRPRPPFEKEKPPVEKTEF